MNLLQSITEGLKGPTHESYGEAFYDNGVNELTIGGI